MSDDVEFWIYARPGSRRREAVGVHDGCLAVAVPAKAIDGQANKALIEELAKIFSVKRSDVTIVSGLTARRKRVRIAGNSRQIRTLLDQLIGANT